VSWLRLLGESDLFAIEVVFTLMMLGYRRLRVSVSLHLNDFSPSVLLPYSTNANFELWIWIPFYVSYSNG
jgi:hypothetical protein